MAVSEAERQRKREYMKKWRAANAERIKAYEVEYRATHVEERRAGFRSWADRNRERIAENQRARMEADPDLKAASLVRLREWKEAHPDLVAVTIRRAKQRRRNMDPDDIAYAEILYLDPCSYCGVSAEHADHIEPISKGGSPGWENLTSSCAHCNHVKINRKLLIFLLDDRISA